MSLPHLQPHTVELAGLLIPAIFFWAIAAAPVYAVVAWALARRRIYRYVWHRALFDLALYVVILGAVMLFGGMLWA